MSYKAKISIKYTKINSPYNTCIYFGLPPKPISNHGIQSIKATLYPANVVICFFVSYGNGSILIADTFMNIKRIEKQ
jgi:UPF0755 protein